MKRKNISSTDITILAFQWCHYESSINEVGDELVLKDFGDPFLFVMHKDESVQKINASIQQKLPLGNEEFTKWKILALGGL